MRTVYFGCLPVKTSPAPAGPRTPLRQPLARSRTPLDDVIDQYPVSVDRRHRVVRSPRRADRRIIIHPNLTRRVATSRVPAPPAASRDSAGGAGSASRERDPDRLAGGGSLTCTDRYPRSGCDGGHGRVGVSGCGGQRRRTPEHVTSTDRSLEQSTPVFHSLTRSYCRVYLREDFRTLGCRTPSRDDSRQY